MCTLEGSYSVSAWAGGEKGTALCCYIGCVAGQYFSALVELVKQ